MIFNLRKVVEWVEEGLAAQQAKRDRLSSWHFWFAWRPKVIYIHRPNTVNSPLDPHFVWLSTIARKRLSWEYKPKWGYGPITNVVTQPK